MGQFLYFKANATDAEVSRKALQSSPLALPLRDLLRSPKLFGERIVVNTVHNNGPGGHAGVLVNIGDQSRESPFVPGVNGEHQRWEPIGDSGWWIGIDDRWQPTEADLRRDTLTPGYEVVLEDGVAWHCPTVRKVDAASGSFWPQLPMKWVWRDGQMAPAVKDEHRQLWEEACEMFGHYAGIASKSERDVMRFAVHCLNLNYRVADAECGMLGLMDFDQARQIRDVAVDDPAIAEFAELQEKKGSAPQPA